MKINNSPSLRLFPFFALIAVLAFPTLGIGQVRLPDPGADLPQTGGSGNGVITAGDLLALGYGSPVVDLPGGGILPLPSIGGATFESSEPVEQYRAANGRATITGRISPSGSSPGDTVVLTLKAIPDVDWHVYAYSERPLKGELYSPTLVQLNLPEGWKLLKDRPPTSLPVVVDSEEWMQGKTIQYYEDEVDFAFPIRIPLDAEPGTYSISGSMAYQACSGSSCMNPRGIQFDAQVTVGPSTGMDAVVQFTQSKYDTVEDAIDATGRAGAAEPSANGTTADAPTTGEKNAADAFREVLKIAEESSAEETAKEPETYRDDWTLGEFALIILASLLGGLILNIMPCVLPVISLKLLALVQHSGESRSRIFWLNIWYAAGLISVFLILATLAAFAGLSWGEQFTFDWFKIGLIVLVFVMALSLMGVWEIPLPGFVGSGKVAELQRREGALGSFVTGMVTTVLATPCGAPLLGPVFGFLIRQPPGVVYAIFGAVGLGMASPYLLIGINPKLVRFFPKPGAWMGTFKHLMGFLLLGTVSYLFMTIDPQWFVPTFILLIGCWLACWWIGAVPLTVAAHWHKVAWIGGLLVAFATGWAAFTFLYKSVPKWQPIDVAAGEEALESGRIVLLCFTPDAEQRDLSSPVYALNTPSMRDWLTQNDPLLWIIDQRSDSSLALTEKMLELLGAEPSSVVVFPLADPELSEAVLPYKAFDAQVLTALHREVEEEKEKEEETLNWIDFSPLALKWARAEGKTVMLDFTADWCPNCQLNTVTALDTQNVAALVRRNGVVAMKADWTDQSPMIKNALGDLGFNSIPLLVIYPADKDEHKALPDLVTKGQVLDALESAGPSKGFPR